MSLSQRIKWCVLSSLLLPGLLGIFMVPAEGRIPRAQEEPSPQFSGKNIPDPPRQTEAWKPPASKVPDKFVADLTLLFQQGLADPRGGEYRHVTVATGSCWTGDAGVVHTHGWVLPAKEGEKDRFAVCWNGLVYPLVKVGDKADLKKDVQDAITRRKKEKDTDEDEPRPQSDEGWSLWFRNLGNLQTGLLLRLGEGDLASELWEANHPAGKENAPEKPSDFYQSLADHWAWIQFDHALGAHMRGDDAVALHGFRKLTAFAKAAEAEAKKRGYQPDENRRGFLDFLGQLPLLLSDQELRAIEQREAIVCIGPGRDPDAMKRIAALITRLNEVNARQQGQPGGVDLGSDPVVQALIREGEPALEPLLHCFAVDHRLTRSVHFWRDFSRSRTCLGVHEAAYVALSSILAQADFEPGATGDNLTSRGDEKRKELAELIREHVKTAKRLPPAQRWFKVLANDKAKPEQWRAAARQLVSPDDVVVAPGTMVWSSSSVRLRPQNDEKNKLLGESLRDRKDPSVTDLLLKRIKQSDEVTTAADLSLMLAVWEPKTALAPLAEQMKRLREKENWYGYVLLVQRRCELEDRKALDDYVDFIRTAEPKMLGEFGHSNLFSPMQRYPEHPGMAAAAEKLFGDPKSPWLPLLQKREESRARVYELIETPLLRVPAFRKAVLQELSNKGGNGKIRVDKNGSMSMDLPDITNSYGGGYGRRELDIPEEGAGDTFRYCDFVAWKIAQNIEAAPRCELYWSEEKRDKAVAACAAFLRLYGDHLFWNQKSLVNGKPATMADVQTGKAVFALEGETRVVAGLKLPIDARWTTLKNRPHQEEITEPGSGKKVLVTAYQQHGRVVQAEEVQQEGQWRRYYGFVGSNHIARVPAEEIEFAPDQRWAWRGVHDWVSVGHNFHAKLNVPPLTVEPFEDLPPRLPADADLAFAITFRNSGGLDQAPPMPEKAVRLRLLYSPEVISPQGALAPRVARDTEWVEVPLKADAPLQAEKGKTLAPTEEMKLVTVDLRRSFDLKKPGFYRLQLLPLKDGAEGGVPTNPAEVRFSLSPSSPKPKKAE